MNTNKPGSKCIFLNSDFQNIDPGSYNLFLDRNEATIGNFLFENDVTRISRFARPFVSFGEICPEKTTARTISDCVRNNPSFRFPRRTRRESISANKSMSVKYRGYKNHLPQPSSFQLPQLPLNEDQVKGLFKHAEDQRLKKVSPAIWTTLFILPSPIYKFVCFWLSEFKGCEIGDLETVCQSEAQNPGLFILAHFCNMDERGFPGSILKVSRPERKMIRPLITQEQKRRFLQTRKYRVQ